MFPFRDRVEAGRMLATTLQEYANRDDVVVLALPRGGVPGAGPEHDRISYVPLGARLVEPARISSHEKTNAVAIASGDRLASNRRLGCGWKQAYRRKRLQ